MTQSQSATGGTPAAEVTVEEHQLRALLTAQHPDIADLPLAPVDSGFDNMMWRLGERLAVRLPRRLAAVELLEHELAWLPLLAPALPLPTSAPLRRGRPGMGFPWPWSIVPWLPGRPADDNTLASGEAAVLARFLRALHVPAPDNAPTNPYRGGPLAGRADAVRLRSAQLADRGTEVPVGTAAVWEQAFAAPIDTRPTWIHGDLHPRNILVSDRRISGVIDWGDLAAGDPATDLAALWMITHDRDEREQALRAYGAMSAALLARARGWAVFFGVTLLAVGQIDDARHAAVGRHTLTQVTDDV